MILKTLISEIHERKAKTEQDYQEMQTLISSLKEKIDIMEVAGGDAGAMLEELKQLEAKNVELERKYKAIRKQDINDLINQNPDVKAAATKMFNAAMTEKNELQERYKVELLELDMTRGQYIKQLKNLFSIEKQAEKTAGELNYSKNFIGKKEMAYTGINGASTLYNDITGQGVAIIGSGEVSAIKNEI